MSVRGLCDAAYAIILAEYQRPTVIRGLTIPGMQLEEALVKLATWATRVTRSVQEREEDLIARRNNEALRSLGIGVPGLEAG